MMYRTLAVALLVVTAILVVGATPGAAEHEERFDQGETWTLEIGHIGGDGTTCVYDEGEHVNRVEVTDSEFTNSSVYETGTGDTGQNSMQIDIPTALIDVVLYSDGNNDEVDALASENGTCVPNDINDVVVKVYLLHSTFSTPDGMEVLTGEDAGEAPPAGTGSVLVEGDASDPLEDVVEPFDNETTEVDDVVGNETDEVDTVVEGAENIADEVDQVDEVTQDPTGVTETVKKTVEEAIDTVKGVVQNVTNSSDNGDETREVDGDTDDVEDAVDEGTETNESDGPIPPSLVSVV